MIRYDARGARPAPPLSASPPAVWVVSPIPGRTASPMPDIRPFRGVRYDMTHVGALSDVVAPPYDVIDPALQDRLYDASPYNVIRLELNREQADDTPDSNRYTRAARLLKEWTRSGVLREDSQPAYYVYHQTFDGRGPDVHPQGVPGPGPARTVRRGEHLPPRADPRPARRPTAWPSSTRRSTTSARSSASTPTPTRRSSARPRPASATGPRWRRPTISASSTGSGRSTTRPSRPPSRG